jgi:hypothetical protein
MRRGRGEGRSRPWATTGTALQALISWWRVPGPAARAVIFKAFSPTKSRNARVRRRNEHPTFNIQTRSAERGARNVLREGGEGRRLRMEDGDWSAKLEFRTDSLAVSSYLRPCHQLSSNHVSTNLQHPVAGKGERLIRVYQCPSVVEFRSHPERTAWQSINHQPSSINPSAWPYLPFANFMVARFISRSSSRRLRSSRLSNCALPLPTPMATFTRPFFQ